MNMLFLLEQPSIGAPLAFIIAFFVYKQRNNLSEI